MDLTSLENELNSLEELHGQGWVGETEYIRRKEELIAAIELAKLDSSSDDESTEDKQIVNEANEEPDASNFENHKNEQLSSDNADKTNNDNYQNLLSTKNAFPVAVKPNPVKTASVTSQKNESVAEEEEFDPYDMDTKYDPIEEERKKREKKSGVKEYSTYKEYLEHNPEQYHLREDADESVEQPLRTTPTTRGRGGRVMVRAPRGKPSVIREAELPAVGSSPEVERKPVNKPKPLPPKQPIKKNLYAYLDEENLDAKTEEKDSDEPKLEDFNINNKASIFATDDTIVQNTNTEHDEAFETQKTNEKPKADKDKPVVYISDRESDDSAFYDTIKGPDTPTQEIQATWEKLQLEYASKLVLKNKNEWVVSRKSPLCNITYVGGFDISFPKGNKIDACVCLAVVRYSDQRVVFAAYKMIKLKLPYIPGLLNFREVPHYITLLNEVKNHPDYKQYVPDIIMVDGNGILHTRGCGAACQLGYLADIPCLGVAKKLLTVDGVTLRQIDQQFDKEGGKLAKIIGASGKLHGMAFRATARDDVLFVSCGHLIDMDTAAALVEQCTLIGSPEPVKQADLLSRVYIKENFQIKEQP
jgi:deoxyribonuclease V